jgi:hypothetical protein
MNPALVDLQGLECQWAPSLTGALWQLASLVRVFCSGVETPSVLPPSRAARPSCVFCRIAGGNEQPGGEANPLQYEVRPPQAGLARSCYRLRPEGVLWFLTR